MELIFYNGRIVTADPASPAAGAVAVNNGRIYAVGDEKEVLNLKNAETGLIDLRGRTLLPGFNDSHLHLIGYALTAAKVDLRHCAGIEDVVDAVSSFVEERGVKEGDWVLGWGWNQGLFAEKRMPDRTDLDRAAPANPLSIMRTCCHICVANTPALEKAGIARRPQPVEGGSIETDAGGRPTGVLKEQAMQKVMDLIPPLDTGGLKELIKTAARDFLAAGLTSVQTDDLAALGSAKLGELLDAYRELEAEGNLPLRINIQPLLLSPDELGGFLDTGLRTGSGSDFLKIGPLKLLTDGSMGGRTALLAAPYADNPDNCGVAVLSPAEINELVTAAHSSGMQVAAHAIGDQAINMVLDAYEKANCLHPRQDPRFRIVHASMVSPESLERFASMGVIADIQPSFIASDHGLVDQVFGPERAGWTYRWKDFLEKGIVMGGGSDCPVENYNPLEGICAAVTRQDKNGNPPEGWFPGQRLTLDEAIEIYTTGSAYCSYEEKVKGTITCGKMADLVVLSDDIYTVDPLKIKDIRVDMTVVNGRIAFRRE